MSKKPTGGPACPCVLTNETNQEVIGFDGERVSANIRVEYSGKTLRDYFAINADIGNMDELSMALGESLLSRKCPCFKDDPVGLLVWWAEYRAKLRYIEADAMLEARKL